MKKIGWHILAFSALYLLMHFFQNNALGPELLRYYLKDILLVPMLLFSIIVVAKLFKLKINVGNKEIIAAFLYCVLAFEIIIPLTSENRSFDWFDILAYGLGAIWYLSFYKQPAQGIVLQRVNNEKE